MAVAAACLLLTRQLAVSSFIADELQQLLLACQTELLTDIDAMDFDDARAYEQVAGNLVGGLAGGKQLEHSQFRRCQTGKVHSLIAQCFGPACPAEKRPGQQRRPRVQCEVP